MKLSISGSLVKGPFKAHLSANPFAFQLPKKNTPPLRVSFVEMKTFPGGGEAPGPAPRTITATAVLWRGQMKSSITDGERAYLSLVIGRKWVNITGTDAAVDPLSPPLRDFRNIPRQEV